MKEAQQPKPGPKVPMKGKSKAAVYKLQSDIEVATNLKKVLEEHILNGKIEFTLGEVLRFTKREFHKVIMNIIKRKRQNWETMQRQMHRV